MTDANLGPLWLAARLLAQIVPFECPFYVSAKPSSQKSNLLYPDFVLDSAQMKAPALNACGKRVREYNQLRGEASRNEEVR